MATKTEKAFDCIKMKRIGSLQIYRATKGMSHEEKLLYWQGRHAEFMRELAEWRAAAASRSAKRKSKRRDNGSAVRSH